MCVCVQVREIGSERGRETIAWRDAISFSAQHIMGGISQRRISQHCCSELSSLEKEMINLKPFKRTVS